MRTGTLVLVLAAAVVAGAVGQQLKVDVPVRELEERAQRDSNDAAAHYNLALGYWSQKKWAEAERALRKCVGLDPRFAAAYLALAYLPQASGKFWKTDVIVLGGGWRLYKYTAPDSVVEQFGRLYRRAFMLDPFVDIRIVVATEYRGGHVDRFDRALYTYNDGTWDEAHRRFGELLADSAEYRGERKVLYEEILWYHALAAARLGRHEDATGDLQRLVERSLRRETSDTLFRWPLRTNEYRYVLAYVKQRAGDANAAIDAYREALANDLGLYPAHVRMAEVYEGARMWDAALEERRNAINASPDDPTLQLDLGWTLAKAGRFTDAEDALQQAATASPRDPRVPYYLGLVQLQLAKKDEARASFTRFLELAPSRYERQIADARQRLASLQ